MSRIQEFQSCADDYPVFLHLFLFTLLFAAINDTNAPLKRKTVSKIPILFVTQTETTRNHQQMFPYEAKLFILVAML